MRKFFAYIDTIERKALFLTLMFVSAFIYFVLTNDNAQMFLNIKDLIGKSHANSPSADIYCSKKENNSTAFCSDRKAAVNEKWKEVVSSNSGSKKKSAFSMSR